MSGEFSPEVRDQVYERAMGRCEICGEYPGIEYHHRRPRRAGGSRQEDTGTAANCLLLCNAPGTSRCHALVESHRGLAEMMGWLLTTYANPAVNSVVYRGERVFLGDGGGIAVAGVDPATSRLIGGAV